MVWWVVAGVLALLVFAFVWLSRGGRMARGRTARLARIGRMSARLSTSWLGARIRRLFAGRERRARLDAAQRAAAAAVVTQTMGEMKGALMKLGQMMSFVNEDLPPEFRTALASLQSSAPPMDFALVRDAAEQELGRPLERAFARFDEKPIAAASIGQVHRASLPSGEDVAVKIQYPGVGDAIRGDLANVGMLFRVVGMMYPTLDPRPVVDELRERLTEELDYTREAENQRLFARLFADDPRIHVPRVHDAYSTARVLTSELVVGRRFADVLDAPKPVRDRYAEIIYRFVFRSIIQHATFNGDPHPGNYIFDEAGERVTFLDFGCVKFFPTEMMATWKQLVVAHLERRPSDFRERLVALGFVPADSTLDTKLLYDYFRFFYEPFAEDRVFTFTPEYTARSLKMVFAPDGPFAGLTKQVNMPRDFVFVNRIQWGVYSILTKLGATGNWHRIHHEYLGFQLAA